MIERVPSHPIMSCAEAAAFEASRFGGSESLEWDAMHRAGEAIGRSISEDICEIGGLGRTPRILVLAGKGHNGADAMIAAQYLLTQYPLARAEVLLPFGESNFRPLAQRVWQMLLETIPNRVEKIRYANGAYDVVLDGVFGFQFHPPLGPEMVDLFQTVESLPVRMRVAVDLPSGIGDENCFRADYTYGTGILKSSVLHNPIAGRVRYLDLGFFQGTEAAATKVLSRDVLSPLREWRDPWSDKRTHGHVGIIGGSRRFPGAVLMAAMAAVRSGAGLVTAFVPESLAPVFAARLPEAMWVAWPETMDGGLAMEGEHLFRGLQEKLDALIIGPGLGREPETMVMAASVVAHAEVPVVIDADALQQDIVSRGKCLRILTPHEGEWERIQDSVATEAVVVRKGPQTHIDHQGIRYYTLRGGPILARGGSGDILAGLSGGLLAQTPANPCLAACRAAYWHGLAADSLAKTKGATAINTTEILEHLPVVRAY